MVRCARSSSLTAAQQGVIQRFVAMYRRDVCDDINDEYHSVCKRVMTSDPELSRVKAKVKGLISETRFSDTDTPEDRSRKSYRIAEIRDTLVECRNLRRDVPAICYTTEKVKGGHKNYTNEVNQLAKLAADVIHYNSNLAPPPRPVRAPSIRQLPLSPQPTGFNVLQTYSPTPSPGTSPVVASPSPEGGSSPAYPFSCSGLRPRHSPWAIR